MKETTQKSKKKARKFNKWRKFKFKSWYSDEEHYQLKLHQPDSFFEDGDNDWLTMDVSNNRFIRLDDIGNMAKTMPQYYK